jgi:hypothetical protein
MMVGDDLVCSLEKLKVKVALTFDQPTIGIYKWFSRSVYNNFVLDEYYEMLVDWYVFCSFGDIRGHRIRKETVQRGCDGRLLQKTKAIDYKKSWLLYILVHKNYHTRQALIIHVEKK